MNITKVIISGMAFAVLTGCVSIKAGKFSYKRLFGTQQIDKFNGEVTNPDGATYKVSFEGQKADSTALLKTINSLAQVYLKAQTP